MSVFFHSYIYQHYLWKVIFVVLIYGFLASSYGLIKKWTNLTKNEKICGVLFALACFFMGLVSPFYHTSDGEEFMSAIITYIAGDKQEVICYFIKQYFCDLGILCFLYGGFSLPKLMREQNRSEKEIKGFKKTMFMFGIVMAFYFLLKYFA